METLSQRPQASSQGANVLLRHLVLQEHAVERFTSFGVDARRITASPNLDGHVREGRRQSDDAADVRQLPHAATVGPAQASGAYPFAVMRSHQDVQTVRGVWKRVTPHANAALPLALSDERALLVFSDDANVVASLNAESDRIAADINHAAGHPQLVLRIRAVDARTSQSSLVTVLSEALDRIQTLSEEVTELRNTRA